MMCNKCSGITGTIVLIVGILFLLRDFNVWGFWGVSWWSAAFVIFGIAKLCSRSCADCQMMMKGKK